MEVRQLANKVRAIMGCGGLLRCAAALGAALALAGCGGAGSDQAFSATEVSPAGPLGPPDNGRFYPLVEGARWINTEGRLVRVEGQDPGAGPGAWRVVNVTAPADGHQTFRLTPTAVEFVGSRASDPVFRALGDYVLLRLPVRTNDRWLVYDRVVDNLIDADFDGRPDRVGLRAISTVLGYESVTVAAGHFDRALKVRTETRQTARLAATGVEVSAVVVTDAWYVADIGRVLSISTQQSPALQLGRDELQGYRVGPLRTDTQAPVIQAIWPGPGETTAQTNAALDFSEPMDILSTPVPISVTGPAGSLVPVATRWEGPSRLVFDLQQPLLSGTYTVRLDPRLGDWLGNTVETGLTWQTVLDLSGPRLTRTSPSAGATEVPVGSTIDIALDEPAELLSVQVSQGDQFLSGALTGSGQEWRFTPEVPWIRAARHEVVVSGFDRFANRFEVRYGFDTEVGRFIATAAPPTSEGHAHIATADIDGDGRSDAVVLRTMDGSSDTEFLLFRQRASGGFEASRIGPAFWLDERFKLLDLDEDGRIDLLPSAATVWWRQTASGRFEAQVLPSEGTGFYDAQAMRSGSRRLDIVGNLDWQPRVMRQTAAGQFAPVELLATPLWGEEVVVADLDGDGLDDIVVTNLDESSAGILTVFYQGADGSFGRRKLLPASGPADQVPHHVRALDIDLDGRRDLVFSMGGTVLSSLRVIRQTAPGVFGVASGPDDAGRWAEVADMDGDGLPDLISAGSGFVALHLQRPDGSFAAGELYHDSRISGPTDAHLKIAVADFNGDGRPDIWAGGVLLLQRGAVQAAGRLPSSSRLLSWPVPNMLIR